MNEFDISPKRTGEEDQYYCMAKDDKDFFAQFTPSHTSTQVRRRLGKANTAVQNYSEVHRSIILGCSIVTEGHLRSEGKNFHFDGTRASQRTI